MKKQRNKSKNTEGGNPKTTGMFRRYSKEEMREIRSLKKLDGCTTVLLQALISSANP